MDCTYGYGFGMVGMLDVNQNQCINWHCGAAIWPDISPVTLRAMHVSLDMHLSRKGCPAGNSNAYQPQRALAVSIERPAQQQMELWTMLQAPEGFYISGICAG